MVGILFVEEERHLHQISERNGNLKVPGEVHILALLRAIRWAHVSFCRAKRVSERGRRECHV